jgi:hypothetical protein
VTSAPFLETESIMSLTNVGDGSSRFGSFPFWGNRSRISWGAVLAGAVVAAATSFLLSLLGAAFGTGSIGDLQASHGEADGAGIGAALWAIIDLALSMAFGGYVASRLSGTHSHLDGELHGITMWALATLIGLLGFAGAVGGGIERMGFNNIGPAIIGPATSQNIQAGPQANPQQLINNFEASLGRTGDPTTMTHEQIGSEIRSLLGDGLVTNGSLSEADRARLVSLVAAQYGLTTDQATQRVARLEGDARARFVEADQRARALADEAAQGVASSARAVHLPCVRSARRTDRGLARDAAQASASSA